MREGFSLRDRVVRAAFAMIDEFVVRDRVFPRSHKVS